MVYSMEQIICSKLDTEWIESRQRLPYLYMAKQNVMKI